MPFETSILLIVNPLTSSENVIVTVAVSLTFNAVSLIVKDVTCGRFVSMVKLALVYEDVGLLPARSV